MELDTATILQFILSGILETLQPMNLLILFVGLVVGIIGGMLPGISTVTSVALFVPFTFAMPTATAFIGLGAVFSGAMYGGANSAILINTPGQPAAMATTFDGYPMTRAGNAEKALYLALVASAFGGIFGTLVLLFFFEPLSLMALEFGSEAFFWLGIFGLTTLASMFPGQIMKGLLGGAIGLAISTIGLDPSTGTPRFTFGNYSLVQGLDMVAVMIGLFSISQMLSMLEGKEEFIASYQKSPGAFVSAVRDLFRHAKKLVLSSSLGTFIGALPGAGGNVAAIVAYNEAKRWSKEPEKYGTGISEGVLVPESANNASVGGALVPLLSLGIPGSATAAVLAGGLMAQGITPGPQLMELNPDLAYTFIVSMLVANLGMVLVGFLLAKVCTRILDVPKLYIIPAVISLSMLGAYALRSNMFDVLVMIASGGAAYMLMKGKVMPAGIALGLVLGPIIEEALIVTLMRSKGQNSVADLLIFSPLAMFLIIACIAAVALPMYLNRKHGREAGVSLRAPSLDCLRRYDFWMICLIGAVGVFYAVESLALDATPRIFPLCVYSVITLLSVLIAGVMFFEAPGQSKEPANIRLGVHVAVYMALLAMAYFSIPLVGFYTACFLCMLCMAAYGVFVIGKTPCTAHTACKIAAFSISCILIEYACFGLLLRIQPPRGLFI